MGSIDNLRDEPHAWGSHPQRKRPRRSEPADTTDAGKHAAELVALVHAVTHAEQVLAQAETSLSFARARLRQAVQ